MAKKYLYFIIIILCVTCGLLGGWIYFITGTDGQFEQSYKDAQSRIVNIEEQLERSRGDVQLLREENQRVREYADEVEGDRIKLAEINRELEIILGQLRADNRRLGKTIADSRARFDIIAGGLEDLERLLQEIEGTAD